MREPGEADRATSVATVGTCEAGGEITHAEDGYGLFETSLRVERFIRVNATSGRAVARGYPILQAFKWASRLSLIAHVLLILFWLFSYLVGFPFGGGGLIGSYTQKTVHVAPSVWSPARLIDLHTVYRGFFFANGEVAIGTLTVVTPAGGDIATMTRRVRMTGGVPNVPYAHDADVRWSVGTLQSVHAEVGHRLDGWLAVADCVRVRLMSLILITAVLPYGRAMLLLRRASGDQNQAGSVVMQPTE